MINLQHLTPQCLSDFSFSNPALEKAAQDFANGVGHNHLMLYGDPGTGKSLLAEIIHKERYPALSNEIDQYRIEGSGWRDNETGVIAQQASIQQANGEVSSIFIVEEADLLKPSQKDKLKSFIDRDAHRLNIELIVTTNRIGAFSSSFVDRFTRFEVPKPQPKTMESFIDQAFAARNAQPTQRQREELLKCSSWRQLDKKLSFL